MKRTKRNAILSLIFGLCLLFAICGTSYLGLNVKADTTENTEVAPTEKVVYNYNDGDLKSELTFVDETKLHIKDTKIATGIVSESDATYVYLTEKDYYKITFLNETEWHNKGESVRIVIDKEKLTFDDYKPKGEIIEPVIPEGTFIYEEDEEGVLYFTFLDETTVHVKTVMLNGEVAEKNLKYTYNEEKKYYTITANKEINFTLDLENHLVIEYVGEDLDTVIKDTAKELGVEVERFVMIIAGILSALGVSGATIATFFKWINKKLKKNNEDLKDSKKILAEAKEMFEKAQVHLEEAANIMNMAATKIEGELTEIKKNYEEEKAKREEINKTAAEVLTTETEGGAENDSI